MEHEGTMSAAREQGTAAGMAVGERRAQPRRLPMGARNKVKRFRLTTFAQSRRLPCDNSTQSACGYDGSGRHRPGSLGDCFGTTRQVTQALRARTDPPSPISATPTHAARVPAMDSRTGPPDPESVPRAVRTARLPMAPLEDRSR